MRHNSVGMAFRLAANIRRLFSLSFHSTAFTTISYLFPDSFHHVPQENNGKYKFGPVIFEMQSTSHI